MPGGDAGLAEIGGVLDSMYANFQHEGMRTQA
jgi:hypothetical protein